MKVIFCGSSEYCLPVVEALEEKFTLVAVITKKDSKVRAWAEKNKIPFFTPQKKQELLYLKKSLLPFKPDLMVVADYGLIIPDLIFCLPKNGAINIHFSRLPEYRGASPVQYTILYGEKSAFITFQKMAAKMDTGDIIFRQKFPLSGREKTADLYPFLFRKASEILPEVINNYISGKIKTLKQVEKKATYTKMLTRQDGFLPWKVFAALTQARKTVLSPDLFPEKSALFKAFSSSGASVATAERAIRAFTPWPGVWTLLPGGKRLKILAAEVKENRFLPVTVQIEGKKPVSWKQFLEGYPEVEKSVLN